LGDKVGRKKKFPVLIMAYNGVQKVEGENGKREKKNVVT